MDRLFDDVQAKRLYEIVLRALRTGELDPPLPSEREPQYTARCLLPFLFNNIKILGIEGLVIAGEGSARVRSAYFLGHRFFPDISISYFTQPLIAVEVKYLTGVYKQNSIVSALGQAYLYKSFVYKYSVAVLIDLDNRINRLESAALNRNGLTIALRTRRRNHLLPHRAE